MKVLLFSILLITSCLGRRNLQIENKPDQSSINFILLSIRRDSSNNSQIQLVSESKVAGKLKYQPQNSYLGDNFLTIYLKNTKTIVDSITIEHPLKKHIEYLNESNNFAVLDTMVKKEEFFIRFESASKIEQIIIFEKLNNQIKNKIATVNISL